MFPNHSARTVLICILLTLSLLFLTACGKALPREPEDVARQLTAAFPALPACKVYADRCPAEDPAHLTEEDFACLYTGQASSCHAYRQCENYYIMLSVQPGAFELHILCAKTPEAVESLCSLAQTRADYLNRYREKQKEAEETVFSGSIAAVYVKNKTVILAVTEEQTRIQTALK